MGDPLDDLLRKVDDVLNEEDPLEKLRKHDPLSRIEEVIKKRGNPIDEVDRHIERGERYLDEADRRLKRLDRILDRSGRRKRE